MITTALIKIIYILVTIAVLPITALSDVALSTDFSAGIVNAKNYIIPLNMVLPIPTIAGIFAVFVLYETGYFGYKIIMWIIRRLPTQN